VSWLIVRGQPIEAADGVRTTFTLPKTIADPAKVVPFVGNPAQAFNSYVTPGPPSAAGEYAVTGQVVTLGGPAPDKMPYFRYLTTDEPASFGGILLRVALIGVKDGANVTFTLPQKPASASDVAIFFGTPGDLLVPSATPQPGEYDLAADLLTVTLGLAPFATDALTADIIIDTAAAAQATFTCANDAFYLGLAESARAIIKDFGQQMELSHVTPGVYSPATGLVSSTGSQKTFYGIVDVPSVGDKGTSLRDGTTIRRDDLRVIAEDMGTVPDVDDVLTIGGKDHRIVQVIGVKPACTPVIYDMVVRA